MFVLSLRRVSPTTGEARVENWGFVLFFFGTRKVGHSLRGFFRSLDFSMILGAVRSVYFSGSWGESRRARCNFSPLGSS